MSGQYWAIYGNFESTATIPANSFAFYTYMTQIGTVEVKSIHPMRRNNGYLKN